MNNISECKEDLSRKLIYSKNNNDIKSILTLMIALGINVDKYINTTIYRKIILEKKDHALFKELKAYISKVSSSKIIFFTQLEKIIKNDISNIKYFNFFSNSTQMNLITENPYLIKDIEKPSELIKKTAISKNGELIKHIKNPSLDLQLIAVRQNDLYIQFIDNPYNEILVEAFNKNKKALDFVNDSNISSKISSKNIVNEIEKAYHFNENENENENYELNYSQDKQINKTEYNMNSYKNDIENKVNDIHTELTKKNENQYMDNTNSNTDLFYNKKHEELFKCDFKSNIKILDRKDSLNEQLNYISKHIDIQNLYIAVGFLYKSGIILLEQIIEKIFRNNGNVCLIIGSLQNYNSYKRNNLNKIILGMDRNTADYLNKLLYDNKIHVRTLESSFFHGKFYLIEGRNKGCSIIGSSNISNSAFNLNSELNILHTFFNEDESHLSFKNWFSDIWEECAPVIDLDLDFFSNIEIDDSNSYNLTKVKKMDILTKIEDLDDEEIRYRFNLWLEKLPDNIYSNLNIESLENYILFEYKKYNLLVFESFEPANAYYCFYSKNIEETLIQLKLLSKSQLLKIDSLIKRGYHVNDKDKLKNTINELFK